MINVGAICLVAAVFATVTVLCFYLRGFARRVYLTTKIPGPSLWEIATVYAKRMLCADDMADCTVELCKRNEFQPFGLWVNARQYLLFVSDCYSVGEVYKNKHMTNKSNFVYDVEAEFLGKGLIVLNGTEYRRHRKLLNPAFRKSALESHLPRINHEVSKLLDCLRQTTNAADVDIRSLVHDKACSVAISVFSSGVIPPTQVRYVFEALKMAANLVLLKAVNPFWHLLKLVNPIRKNITTIWHNYDRLKGEIFEERRRAALRVQLEDREPIDMLECLSCGSGENGFTEEECFDEIRNLLGASAETSECAELICLFLLALHPGVQERVYEEQKTIFGDSDRAAQPEDLSKMTYLEMVLKESLRLFPPVPLFNRMVEEETHLHGIILPKGSSVVVNILALHRNPRFFKEPLMFDPDRFSPDKSVGRHPFAYLPFSSGLRNCPGQLFAMMALKASLSRIVRNLRLLPTDDLKTVEDIKCTLHVTFGVKNSLLRVVSRRKNPS